MPRNIGFLTILTTAVLAMALASPIIQAQPSRSSSHADQNNNRSVYHPVTSRGQNYFYRDGLYYRRQGSRYRVIDPPLGIRVGFLPQSAISVAIGTHRYFRVGMTWYLPREREGKQEYEVVEEPEIAEEPNSYADQQPSLIIYPAADQSAEQQDKDEYECYRWAKAQSGYDPTLADQDLTNRGMYQRAITACLESRDYTVR